MSNYRPTFLNEEVLTECLRSEEGSCKVICFEIEPVLPETLNFASIILRVRAQYRKDGEVNAREISLIVKVPPEKECLNWGDTMCRKEHNFYSIIVPHFSKYFDVSIFPKSYPISVPTVVVLEDLCVSNYKEKTRFDQLDFNHCKLFFEAAARMHAASIVMVETVPNIIDVYGTEGNVQKDEHPQMKKLFSSLISIGARSLADLFRNNADYKDVVEFLDDIADNIWSLIIAAEISTKCLKSFVQRDCYGANMMFRYDNFGKVESIKIIDFQIYSYLPAVIDIINFVWRSADNDVRENHLDELYKIYCDNLNKSLSEFESSKSITLDELKEQLNIFSPWVLYMICFYLPYGQAKHPIPFRTLLDSSVENPQKCYDLVRGMIAESPTVFPSILKHLRDQGVMESIRKHYL